MHSECIHHAAIVFRDHEKVVKADPVLNAMFTFISQEFTLAVDAQISSKQNALFTE